MPPLVRLDDSQTRTWAPADEAGFGSLATHAGALPLTAMDVRARVAGLLAEVTVHQTFVNTYGAALEATYVFPLPDRLGVTGFQLEVAGRVVEGVLRERAAARREYDLALEAGHRAAIAEEERPGVFTLRVGNIPPGEDATVRLTLAGPVPYADGEVTFRFPLVVAPRYIPGKPLTGPPVGTGTAADTDAVPDASRISPPVLLPGFPNPVRLALSVEVDPLGLPLGELVSSLHAVWEAQGDGGVRKVVLQVAERLDRDFVLRYRLGGAGVAATAVCRADGADGPGGTLAVTVLPPPGAAAGGSPRDVVFVLDRSGSMGGWKMVAARRSLGRMVDTLTPADRFAVLAFDDQIETPPAFGGVRLVPAGPGEVAHATDFVARVSERGGTEMGPPLELAAHLIGGQDGGRDRVLVLVTDGQVGNEDQILRGVSAGLRGARVFAIGIDTAVNEAFLRRLADLGGGACEVVESEARLEEAMVAIHRRIATPVLTRLAVHADGLDPDSVVPAVTPDLYAGSAVQVFGRFYGQLGTLVRVTGEVPGRGEWVADLPVRGGAASAVGAAWARGFVRQLEDRYVIGRGDRFELEKQLIDVSRRFGVLCRFTAFVAVDRADVTAAGAPQLRVTQPVERARGSAAAGHPRLRGPVAAAGISLGPPTQALGPPSGLVALRPGSPHSAMATGSTRRRPTLAPRPRGSRRRVLALVVVLLTAAVLVVGLAILLRP